MGKAVERCIPDIRDRVEFSIIGSPLAHEAFLRRDRGTYGLAWAAGTSAPQSGLLGGLTLPLPQLENTGGWIAPMRGFVFPRDRNAERRRERSDCGEYHEECGESCSDVGGGESDRFVV